MGGGLFCIYLQQYHFSTANFKASTKKLRLLANQIKGLDIQNAINQMEFSQKRPSTRVMNTLAFARTNAITQEKYAMDASKLYVGMSHGTDSCLHCRFALAEGRYA
jgi:ribosomal protein L22